MLVMSFITDIRGDIGCVIVSDTTYTGSVIGSVIYNVSDSVIGSDIATVVVSAVSQLVFEGSRTCDIHVCSFRCHFAGCAAV